MLPTPHEVWLHPKTDGLYVIVGLSFEERTGDVFVVYRGGDGMMHHRPLGSFLGNDPERKAPRFVRIRGE